MQFANEVLILVGTMSGTAEMVADSMADELEEQGIAARIVRMENARPSQVASASHVIVCTSTYGKGEVPDNAKALLAALKEERPKLDSLLYGVFSLGSSAHKRTFCFGGRHFDEMLVELGATRLGEHFQQDDRGGIPADEAGDEWISRWIEAANRNSGKPDNAGVET